MNLAEDSNPTQPRQSVFGYSCPAAQWSQVTPPYMPWGHSPTSPAAPLVTFSARPQQQLPDLSLHSTMSFGHTVDDVNSQPSTSAFGHKSLKHCKRKADLDISIPVKQHITEEKMAAHMSRLHISTENSPELLPPGNMEDSTSRQKRLYVCEEMRRLQTESILPSAILGRLERPCMAVMLWQPPAKIPELISSPSASRRPAGQHHHHHQHHQHARTPPEEDENDNNASTADLNHMDMEQ